MSPNHRHMLGGVAAVALSVWLVGRGVPAALHYTDAARLAMDEMTVQLRRARLEVARINVLNDSISALEDVVGRLPLLILAGRDGQIATLDLIRRLTLIAGNQDVAVDSILLIPDETAAGRLRRASARAHVETDAVGLAAVLAAIEADPALGIERFTATAVSPRTSVGDIEIIEVELVVIGWYLPAVADSIAPGTTA